MLKLVSKYSFLFDAGGVLYVLIELAWRSWSHWTMFVLGGLCFIYLGLINEIMSWDMPLWQQVWIGAVGITALEFLTGCVVNLWLVGASGTTADCLAISWGRFVLSIWCYGCRSVW